MASPIVVKCPECAQKYRLPPDKIGLRARCRCGQRFTVVSEQPLDEDTVLGWVIDGADPSSQSVLGGTSIMDAQNPEEPVPNTCILRFKGIDKLGAHFEFEPQRLKRSRFRSAFPQQCLGCDTSSDLNVHLVVWHQKLPEHHPLHLRAVCHQNIGTLKELRSDEHSSLRMWIKSLPEIKNLPKPYSAPFPFYVCRQCKIEEDLGATVQGSATREMCELTIANFTIAAHVYGHIVSHQDDAYDTLMQHSLSQDRNRWRELPGAIRRQIMKWYQPQDSEQFKGYFPDSDFGRTEAGKAGVVLTDKRLSYHKYASFREFPVAESGTIHVEPKSGNMLVRITQSGSRDATLHMNQSMAEQLVSEIHKINARWSVTGHELTGT